MRFTASDNIVIFKRLAGSGLKISMDLEGQVHNWIRKMAYFWVQKGVFCKNSLKFDFAETGQVACC